MTFTKPQTIAATVCLGSAAVKLAVLTGFLSLVTTFGLVVGALAFVGLLVYGKLDPTP